MKRSSLRKSVWAAVLAVVVAAALALAACGGSSTTATTSPSPAPTEAAASPSAEPSASATPLPTPTVAGTIAFAGGYGGERAKYDMFTVRTDGSGLKTIEDAVPSAEFPAWSPDGKKIEFSLGQPGVFYNVWVMNADGSGKTRLTDRRGGVYGGWSPDGSRIAYSSWYYPEDEYPPAHVFVMNADGSGPRQLTRGPHNDMWPCGQPMTRSSFCAK